MRHDHLFAWSVVWIITCATLGAQSPKPTELMPATTVFYAEGTDSETFLQLPLVKDFTQSPLFQQLWKTPDAMKLRGGITLAEVALGERLQEAIGKLTSGGWAIALDRQSQGIVLWARARDKSTREELYKKLISLAEADAKSKGRELKHVNYREVNAYEVGGNIIAGIEDYLVLTNKSELAKNLVDRLREPPARGDTLAGNQRFADFERAREQKASGNAKRLAHAWLDIEQLHAAGLAKKLFQGPHDNFPAELLIGGVVAVLRGAPALEASVDVEDKHVHLHVHAPLTKSAVSDRYDYFFGPDLSGQAPAPLKLEGTQANLCLYRDIAQLWLRAGDLFGQKTNDQLAQAETTLTTLFSGRDFANDILGSIKPELQLLVVEQGFGKSRQPVPQIKLPAFALVTRLRDPQTMQPQMKRIFMSLIGFANVAGAMNQQPQLDLEAFRLESGWEVTATYAVEADRPKDWVVPIQYNFSPSLLMVGDYAVVSSTKELSQAIRTKLADQPEKPIAPQSKNASGAHLNSIIHLDGALVKQSLAANREQLISQNMIEKGHSQEEAAGEVDLLLRVVGLIQALDIGFSVGKDAALDVNILTQ